MVIHPGGQATHGVRSEMKDEALRRKHEVEGVAIAGKILRNLGYDGAFDS